MVHCVINSATLSQSVFRRPNAKSRCQGDFPLSGTVDECDVRWEEWQRLELSGCRLGARFSQSEAFPGSNRQLRDQWNAREVSMEKMKKQPHSFCSVRVAAHTHSYTWTRKGTSDSIHLPVADLRNECKAMERAQEPPHESTRKEARSTGGGSGFIKYGAAERPRNEVQARSIVCFSRSGSQSTATTVDTLSDAQR